ncbi:MAG: helix-turn-helix transcriptional regulator [Deltaproteobacteria bacterium]|nr:helix-turn-helix transcriptional regulator [Deltaproteobacteria bacterium]
MIINYKKCIDIRKNKMLSITELAHKASVSYFTVKRFEGGSRLKLESYKRILSGLGYTVEEAYKEGLIVDDEL